MDVQEVPSGHIERTELTTETALQEPTSNANENDASVAEQATAGQLTLRWRSRLAPWWRTMLAILPVFLITRLVFLLLTYFGTVLFTVSNYSSQALPLSTVWRGWYRWDVIRFQQIATQGYATFDNTAFFPLYPWLERVLAALLHISSAIFLAGMLISNVAFFGVLVVLFRLVETEFDHETAQRSTLYLAIFPTAMFFFAAYNESLFLLFLLLSFYALRQRAWWIAGICGGLAALTRSFGLLLLPVFLYEFVRQIFPVLKVAWPAKEYKRCLVLLSGLLPSICIPCGLGIYALYLYYRYHDPLAFSHAETHWHLGPTFPWYAPIVALSAMLHFSPFTFSTTHNVIDLTALVLFATLLLLCFVGPERFYINQWSMLLFAILALAIPLIYPGTAYNPLPSMERYVLELFPGFILLARLGRHPWFHQAYLLIALPMLAFFTLQFLTGHWTI